MVQVTAGGGEVFIPILSWCCDHESMTRMARCTSALLARGLIPAVSVKEKLNMGMLSPCQMEDAELLGPRAEKFQLVAFVMLRASHPRIGTLPPGPLNSPSF